MRHFQVSRHNAGHLSCVNALILTAPLWVWCYYFPIPQMRKLWHREVKEHAQGSRLNTAVSGSISKTTLLTACRLCNVDPNVSLFMRRIS